MGVLTENDKEYLRKYSKYLELLTNKSTLYIETYSDGNDINEIFDDIKEDILEYDSFGDSSAEVTDKFKEIIGRVLDTIQDPDSKIESDAEYFHNCSLFVVLDLYEQELEVTIDFSFTETNYSSTEYTDDEVEEVFESLKDSKIKDNQPITVEYNGGGDSGSLEYKFSNGQAVPSDFEDWCYRQLSNNYGGWELDMGSQGEFLIDFENKAITLTHGYNEDRTESLSFFKESFAE